MHYVAFQKLWHLVAAVGDCQLVTNDFFGLKPWYAYLQGEQDALGQCNPVVIARDPSGNIENIYIAQIALAIVDLLLRVSVLVAVAFVIYGGIQYVISQGEPDKTNTAKNTIINALIGLIIAITATAAVSFIGGRIV